MGKGEKAVQLAAQSAKIWNILTQGIETFKKDRLVLYNNVESISLDAF